MMTFKCSICPWTGKRADAVKSVEGLPGEGGKLERDHVTLGCPLCSSALEFIVPLPSPMQLAERFVTVLKRWAKDRDIARVAWDQMLADNAAETDPNICHSHDWCDANMAMAEAFEDLGAEQQERWGDDWAANEEASALWNAAWKAAMPALGRKETVLC